MIAAETIARHPWWALVARVIRMMETLLNYSLMRCCSLVMAGLMSAMAAPARDAAELERLSIEQLEQRLEGIDENLASLASFSLLGGVGGVGFRSQANPSPEHSEWVRIDLGSEYPIDQIVLVPTIWRDSKNGFRQDGFPEEFHITAGTGQDSNGTVVASFTARDRLLPRIAPVIVNCPGVTASWIRVDATLLSPRAWDGLFDMELSEILVFSGRDNVALRRPTQASSHFDPTARLKESLVDGFMPYLMDAATGEKSNAFVSVVGTEEEEPASMTFDLGTSRVLQGIHLHAVDTSDNVPQSTPTDFGIPRHLVVEGANLPDFQDAVVLAELRVQRPIDTGPINMLQFPQASCRYVRFIAAEPYVQTDLVGSKAYFGFAEIEIFSAGQNVVRGIEAITNFTPTDHTRSISALTDGLNLYGTILPIRDWLGELALRHELETERPLVMAELNQRFARQKVRLVWMGWLITVLAAGIVLVVLIDRMLRMRQVARIRERFAADLHDELGADLHSIRLLGELALTAKDTPERLDRVLRNSQEIAHKASMAVRHCMNMQEANGLYGSLKQDMHRTAQRIMAQLDYDITVEGEDFLQRLKPRTKTDLFLFFKECLINISRHADATRFSTQLTATRKEVRMVIRDNGRGLPDTSAKGVPKSIQRRARLLGARVAAGQAEGGGTRITLTLPTRRFGFRK